MSAALCRHDAQHRPGSMFGADLEPLWRRVSEGRCGSTREMRHRLARRRDGRRLWPQPQVREDLLDLFNSTCPAAVHCTRSSDSAGRVM